MFTFKKRSYHSVYMRLKGLVKKPNRMIRCCIFGMLPGPPRSATSANYSPIRRRHQALGLGGEPPVATALGRRALFLTTMRELVGKKGSRGGIGIRFVFRVLRAIYEYETLETANISSQCRKPAIQYWTPPGFASLSKSLPRPELS